MRHRPRSKHPEHRTRRPLTVAAAALAAVALLAPAAAAPTADGSLAASPAVPTIPDPGSAGTKITRDITLPDGTDAEAIENRWFVELASPAVAAGGDAAAVAAEQDQLAAAIRDAGIDAAVTTAYGELWNGVALTIDDADIDSLAQLDEVVSIQPVVRIPEPAEQYTADSRSQAEQAEGMLTPQMTTALDLTGADLTHTELGYTGAGVKIGIIDSGVDYDHTEFGGTGAPGAEAAEGDGSTSFPNAKVTVGYDFVGDAYGDPTTAAKDMQAAYKPVPDAYPDDCSGHGTHVAGIAAARGTAGTAEVTGVAPDAQIGAYRVFGCQGSSDAEVMAAAMQQAAADGMDVINLSVSADYMVVTDYPITASAEALAAQGVIITASQGNAGEAGVWSLSAPAAAPHVLAAGSVDNTIALSHYLTASSDSAGTSRQFLYAVAEGTSASPQRDDDVHYPLVASGDLAADGGDEATDPSLLCQAAEAEAFAGKIVLVRRGGCDFYTKAANAQAAGAVGVVFDNSAPGQLGVSLTSSDGSAISIPAVAIDQASGDALRAELRDDSQLTFAEEPAEFNISTGGKVSAFSSWGLNTDLGLKPDVVTPGGYIWSTWPLEDGGYRSSSGTSMASPYLAGAVALILQAHPETRQASGTGPVDEVAWRLRSTATPLAWSGADDAATLEPVAHQGAGLIDVDAAIRATTAVSASVLNLGESEHYPDGNTQEVTLTNRADTAVTYALSHTDAVTVTGPASAPERGTSSPATVSTDGSTITVPAAGTATVAVTITAPADAADGDLYGGWLELTPEDGAQGQAIRIPYSGVAGNLAAAQVFGDATAIVDLDGNAVNTGRYVFGDSTRTAEGAYEDLPAVLVEPLIPFRGAVMEVSRVYNDGTVSFLGPADYDTSWRVRGRNIAFVWSGGYYDADGSYQQAPTGDYQLTIRVCPIGGDGTQASDWAAWTSPEISIDWKTADYLPQSSLAVTAPDTAASAVDDNIFTTATAQAAESGYVIDLGDTYDVTKVHYTPDQETSATHATSLDAQVSQDGENWEPVGMVEIDPTRWAPAVLELDQAVRARYVRVDVANTRSGEENGVSVAELRVAGNKSPAAPGAASSTGPGAGTGADPSGTHSGAVAPTGGAAAPSSSGAGAQPSASAPSSPAETQAAHQGSGAGQAAAAGIGSQSLARTGAYTAFGLVALALVLVGSAMLWLRRHYRL
ncbi:S8 family serine peptidase [Actinomyces sp. 432]|uniref:S8 family serine peptidase n=1 Tax=Actinomyces sp. 432 TaxID=2057798 RepID=UPI0023514524|nr:S8 family serine peptidase [Actinomyces sp. 432]